MPKAEMSFSKDLVYVNSLYGFHNTLRYEISEENSIKSSLTVRSTFSGELHTEDKIYHIKPISKFFTIKAFEILLETSTIGRIEYWGWTWRKPKLLIYTKEHDEVWVFERNEPGLFKKRASPYMTKLTCGDKEVNYKIELEDSNNGKGILSRLSGVASFKENDRLVCHLGIYLNELLIFDEMNK
jgi:hypothetical protein